MKPNIAEARVGVILEGRVQGVGFRYTVKSLSPGYEVTGTVRNRTDGAVELVAEGSEEELDAFLQAVRDSGLGPMIRDESVQWAKALDNLSGFEIVR